MTGFFYLSFNYNYEDIMHYHGHKARVRLYLRYYLSWEKYDRNSYSFTHACFQLGFSH